jgi:hypothetical protein
MFETSGRIQGIARIHVYICVIAWNNWVVLKDQDVRPKRALEGLIPSATAGCCCRSARQIQSSYTSCLSLPHTITQVYLQAILSRPNLTIHGALDEVITAIVFSALDSIIIRQSRDHLTSPGKFGATSLASYLPFRA